MVKVAAVFGLSGVGKSWLVSRFAESAVVAHVQASQMLREARAAASGCMESQEELRQGTVLDNQALLISAFSNFRATATEPIIFDGHSVIDVGDYLVEIPVEVIRAIATSGIVFVQDEPSSIIARRASDQTRMRPIRSETEISSHQARARALCDEYAEQLGVPLTVVRAGDEECFAAAINSIMTIN